MDSIYLLSANMSSRMTSFHFGGEVINLKSTS